MKIPLFIGILMTAVTAASTRQDLTPVNVLLLTLFILLLVLPYIFHSAITASVTAFSEQHHPFGRKLLSIHGLVFLAVLQPLAILWSAEVMMPAVSGLTHGVVLMIFMVAAGLFAVAARPSSVRALNHASAAMLSGIIIVMTGSVLIGSGATLPAVLRPGHPIIPAGNGEMLLMFGAGAILVFWTNWMESSAAQDHASDRRTVLIAVAAAVVLFSVIVFSVSFLLPADAREGALTSFGSFLSFAFVAGAVGLFAGTVSSAGTLVTEELYPQFSGSLAGEKRELINRLATVFTVIASVLSIPFVRSLSADVPQWYVGTLAAFAAPVVAAYFITTVVRKQRPFALSLSMMLGGLVVLPGFIGILLTDGDVGALFMLPLRGLTVTIVCYIVLGGLQEFVVIQRLLSLLRQS